MGAKKEVIEAEFKLAKQFQSSPDLMPELERQRGYIASLHFAPVPCWMCGEGVTFYDAVEESYDPKHYEPHKKFHCPHCKTEMIHVVPLFQAAAPAGWFWGNPKIYRKEEGTGGATPP